MKKRLFIFLIMIPALMLTGCAPVVHEDAIPEEYSVYASFLPVFMLSGMIIRENIPSMNLNLLVQPQDGCMRSYVLSDWDSAIAEKADALILIGNGFETFESTVSSYGENGPAVISAASSLVLHASGVSDTDESHLSGANPWLFLSVDGAIMLLEAIAANMIALDPGYEDRYIENLDAAIEKMEHLKLDMAKALENAGKTQKVALAHEGLIYLSQELGLNAVVRIDREAGAYPDQAETEDMISRIHSSGAKAVLIEKQAPQTLIKAFEAAGVKPVLIDTLSTGSAQNGDMAYFERMLENAVAIADALRK